MFLMQKIISIILKITKKHNRAQTLYYLERLIRKCQVATKIFFCLYKKSKFKFHHWNFPKLKAKSLITKLSHNIRMNGFCDHTLFTERPGKINNALERAGFFGCRNFTTYIWGEGHSYISHHISVHLERLFPSSF